MVASDKVLLETTVGDIEVELWSREAPKACRNFVQGPNSIKKSWLELWLQISKQKFRVNGRFCTSCSLTLY